MSAFLCSDTHFNVLVSYFVSQNGREEGLWLEVNGDYGYLNQKTAPKVAEILHNQNMLSLIARYGADRTGVEDYSYEFTYYNQTGVLYSVLEIAGALDCLEYQSCETDDYYQTEAYKILCLMRKYLLRQLQDETLGNDTVWEINKVKTTTRIGAL